MLWNSIASNVENKELVNSYYPFVFFMDVVEILYIVYIPNVDKKLYIPTSAKIPKECQS